MPDAVERRETGSDRSGEGGGDPVARGAPSLAILGADALLAAQPATAVQLAHACVRIGYHAVVPASWGDELIASGCLRQIASRRSRGDTGPAIFCSCPYVAHRVLAVGSDLEPFLTSFVAPPVAVARYLRTLYAPTRIRLTYVGRCPGAADDAIDARLTPDELLAVLTERGVDLAEQPRVFDSVIPPDRRRFLSQPGGLPAPEMLRRIDAQRNEVDVSGSELATELAQVLLSKANVLIDLSTRLGCVCSGAVANIAPEAARAAVTALEPPRASSPIVDERIPVPIELPLPPVARDPIDVVPAVAGRRTSGASRAVQAPESSSPESPADVAPPSARRRSPTHGIAVRQHAGAIPTTRSGEGRALPRAYVARRGQRSGGGGQRTTPPRGEPSPFDASTRSDGRAGNGGSPRSGDPSRTDRVEPTPSAPSAVPQSAVSAPSGETPVMSRRPRAAAVGAAPDRADDPHGEPFIDAGGSAVVPEHAAEALAAQVEARSPSRVEPRGPSRISAETAPPALTFRTRTAALARRAVSTAQQRRAVLAALLGVALLSASVGVLAGRWLAARASAGAMR